MFCTILRLISFLIVASFYLPRVPGNAAAVQLLQEELDSKEPDSINFEEEVATISFEFHSFAEVSHRRYCLLVIRVVRI